MTIKLTTKDGKEIELDAQETSVVAFLEFSGKKYTLNTTQGGGLQMIGVAK